MFLKSFIRTTTQTFEVQASKLTSVTMVLTSTKVSRRMQRSEEEGGSIVYWRIVIDARIVLNEESAVKRRGCLRIRDAAIAARYLSNPIHRAIR